jgi:hypothetical protein
MAKVNDLIHTKDPRGLVRRDVEHLSSVFKERPVSPTMTQNEIMFQAGQQSVIRFINDKMVK